MRQVTKEEFFARVGGLDVHPRIINSEFPYTSLWEFPRQPGKAPIGKSVGRKDGGTDYFLADKA